MCKDPLYEISTHYGMSVDVDISSGIGYHTVLLKA